MRLTYSLSPKYTFDLEGSPYEIFEFVQLITVGAQELPAATQLQVIEPTKTMRKRNINSRYTDDFVKSIYLYNPNPANDSGRGSFIAHQIIKGKVRNIDKLAKLAQGSRASVLSTIQRMVDNGAEIEVNGSIIKLISLPPAPYKLKLYNNGKPVAVQRSQAQPSKPTTTVASSGDLMSALSSLKLSS